MARKGNIPRDESWINDPVTGEEIGWRETYGIHSLEILPMEENRVPGPPLYIREFNRLAVTARDDLQVAGEQTDQEIAEPFVLAQTLGGVHDDRPIHDALRDWVEDIILRHGKLSRLSFAARFLAAGRIMTLANRTPSDPAGMQAICSFAHAWHYYRMEISGVHATAFYGKSRAEDFTKCTTTKAAKKKTRDAVILQQVEDLFNNGTSCGDIAKHNHNKINAVLHVEGFKPITQLALERRLQRMKRLLQRIK
jgi:hypothetical protein